jgi:hypothetical protein
MTTNPDIDVNTPSPIYVSARPGQTYAFTAAWKDAEDVSLEQ